MKKIGLLILFVISHQTFGQSLEKTLLWKITGNEIKETSFLFGTIHITCKEELPVKVIHALKETKQLYLELDMDDPSLQMAMMNGMMMKEGTTMSSLATKEDFRIVDDFLKKQLGLSAQMLNSIKPFMVSAMLYPKMIDCEMKSVEEGLVSLSKEQNEEIYGLETIDEQLAVFDAIPYEVQMNELIKSAKNNLEGDKAEIDLLFETYQSEDIEAMITLMRTSENEISSKFETIMLTERNKKWVPRIISIAKEKPTFFGVGAGHLGGENGVINLLRKAGYKVDPVF
ncbi:MAG: TraB/GumN family protein [Flavobacterium sp.]|nr:TraB/GumN family protein [Flavobacterium sp.]